MAALRSLLALALAAVCVTAAPDVNAPYGLIVGKDSVGVNGRAYSSYLAIPFALAPVGSLRFAKPMRNPGPGQGQRVDAGTPGPKCPQDGVPDASEDCLTLDVHVPATPAANNQPRAVMVYIHGGGFTAGGSSDILPSELVTENDVIVVVIQYRLGVLGFLSTGDDVLPGNLGLWDQHMAIQWAKDNIGAFGGNPSQITIFGESAGAASVGYHVISPLTKDLFQRAVLQSGIPFASWAYQQEPAKVFSWAAGKTGCSAELGLGERTYYRLTGRLDQENQKRELACLKATPAADLFKNVYALDGEFGFTGINPWVPTTDGELVTGDPGKLVFDPEYLNSVGATSKDLLVGATNQEGGLLLTLSQFITPELGTKFADIYKIDEKLGRNILEGELLYRSVDLRSQPTRLALVADVLEFFFLKPFGANGQPSLTDVSKTYSAIYFNLPMIEFSIYMDYARQKAAGQIVDGRHFLYVFDHFPAARAGQELNGVYHAEDLVYEFDPIGVFANARGAWNSDDFTVGSNFRAALANFAKQGAPQTVVDAVTGAQWPEFDAATQSYLSLSATPRALTKPYAKTTALLLDLVPKIFNNTQPAKAEPMVHWWPLSGQQSSGMVPVTFRGTMTLYKLH